MSTEPEAEDIHFQALPLTGDAGDAFVAITAMMEAALVAADPEGDLENNAFALASRLVARAIGGPGAPTDAELRVEAVERTEAATAVAEAVDYELATSIDDIPEEVMRLAEQLIREAALEEHTHDAYLALQGDSDTILLVVMPVSIAAAHVWLLESLYDRVEAGIMDEPLEVLERGASAWWFERWRPAKPVADDEFAAGVREQEWSLVDRPTLSTESSFIEDLVEDEEALATFPPRQRHMARQLLESSLGIWQVRERAGDVVALVSAVDGAEHTLREHGGVEEYGEGAVVIGRLIPFGDGTWLRSPGAVVNPEPLPEWTRALADALKATDTLELPPSIILEAALTAAMTGERVPRTPPPARSASEARKILENVMPLFIDAGIARPLDPSEVPEELRSTVPDGPLYDNELDLIVSDWMQALSEMGRKGTGGGKSKGNRRKRR